MSDNLRRYRAIRDALTQWYPGQPTGTVARHLTTLAALISGIVGSKSTQLGFDHGVGHSLLLLYDAKTPYGQKANEFNVLVHDLSNTSIGLLWIITKYSIYIAI